MKHEAIVLKIDRIEPHPNADSLDLVFPFGGYTSCVKRGQFNLGDLYVYITPDTIVDGSHKEFAFLGNGKHVIKAKKLRGIVSQGLVIPAPNGVKEGDNLFDFYGFDWHEPELNVTDGADSVSGPSYSKYDIESLKKYHYVFEGQCVTLCEKIHGQNWRAVYHSNQYYVGTRSHWKTEGDNIFWHVLSDEMRTFLKKYPDHVLYGELYGKQDIKYNVTKPTIAIFDILTPNGYLSYPQLTQECNRYHIPIVPMIKIGEFNFDEIKRLAEEPSALYNGGKEGIVVRTLEEGWHPELGRKIAKYVSDWYYTRKEK